MSAPVSVSVPPAVVFSDWDGTITSLDSNDYLTDNLGFGHAERMKLNDRIIAGTLNFRDAFAEMLASVTTPLPECIEILKQKIPLDPGFKTFYTWCKAHNIPVIIVSSGMLPIIKALLVSYLGDAEAEDLKIYANDVAYSPDGSWNVAYRDPESGFGHDKSRTIRAYTRDPAAYPAGQQRPKFFYCGDGVSDLSAARETDLLFAKKGKDLITYCVNEGVPFTVFEDFTEIHKYVQDVVEGRRTVEDIVDAGAKLGPTTH
ncbi:putative phosphatase [Drechslerella stenobrocha 248]|uniref:Putative phosphatase n=1 Tax=Drechslerella stenobrocha 248 TaxID=1043628 RepID=W7HWQ8_9PEZI|nr:putative phosphatase [Drechslerella stenobrocha 248]